MSHIFQFFMFPFWPSPKGLFFCPSGAKRHPYGMPSACFTLFPNSYLRSFCSFCSRFHIISNYSSYSEISTHMSYSKMSSKVACTPYHVS